MIEWSHFEKLDIRAGTIIDARHFAEAKKPAYQLRINFGPIGILQSSAQITECYQPEQLVGMQIIAVVNFPPKRIAGFISQCLVLGLYSSKGVVLLQPSHPVTNGDKVG